VLFALFALGRAVVQYRRRVMGLGHLASWVAFWVAVAGFVLVPQATQWIAGLLGVGRGADATFYIAIVGLSYAYFRLYLRFLEQERNITKLVRQLALREGEKEEGQAAESSAASRTQAITRS
jgi:hypothetical protein